MTERCSRDVTEIRVVGYEPGRRAEILRLMHAVWGTTRLEQEWEWWFERNPAGPPIISLAEADGRVVGVACMSPYRVQIAGEKRVVPVPLHLATHPAFRGRGVFSALELENERRAAERYTVALIFPNAASQRVLEGRLGWHELPAPRLWARLAVRRRAVRGVKEVADFGREVDGLWQALARTYGDGLVRDAAYLNWRFASSPRAYTCLASDEGIAVLGRRAVRNRTVSYVAELLAPPGAATRRLLRAALRRAGVLLALPPAARTGDVVQLGFVPTPRRISVLAKLLRPEGRIPAGWTFSLGDGDSW